MASGLDRVRVVEAVFQEWHLEEVLSHDLTERVELGFLVLNTGSIHLVIIDCDAHDLRARMGRDGSHGPTDSAPNVKELHVDQINGHFFVDACGLAVGLSGDRQ